MTPRIALALVLHNHQPVGNFGWVIEDAFRRAYEPMLDALERHPGVRVGLHYSGPLLEWLAAARPAAIARIRALVERGQVEILGGGLAEPVLVALPDRDRLLQLTRMADLVERTFGRRPTTAWLAERVWEPDLPAVLADAGYTATILDDAHFQAAAVPDEALWQPHLTHDRGRRIAVFGTEQGLRYRIPFRPVEGLIEYLRGMATEAGDRLGTMGDDGEKFGAWPDTHEHCWGPDGWVERCFSALEANAAWLATTTPGARLAEHPPTGRITIPGGSYAEMGEWALPPAEARAFHAARAAAVTAGGPEVRWLRGAPWRNFAIRYREIGDLARRMLRVSDAVAVMPDGPDRASAVADLLRGQSNDAYWHGLFGGVYLPHLRAATSAHLIAAEDAADRSAGRSVTSQAIDLDEDGADELRLSTEGQVVTIEPSEGAGVEWDLRAAAHHLTGVLRRRPEAYHDRLDGAAAADESPGSDGSAGSAPAGGGPSAGGGPASIHEVVRSRERGLAARLVFDRHERRSGLLRVLPPDLGPAGYGAGEAADLARFLDGAWSVASLEPGRAVLEATSTVMSGGVDAGRLSARATIELAGGRLDPVLRLTHEVVNVGATPLSIRIGQEWALTMLGGGGNPDAWYDVAGERTRHDARGAASATGRIGQGNEWLGVSIETRPEPTADAWWAPIETISNSEDGFERVYQGSSLLLSWPVTLEPGASARVASTHRASIARERAPGG